MKKGCVLTLGIMLGLVAGAIGVVYFHFKNEFDPIYHGKRIYTWADQAIWDDDPEARQEAVRVCFEALEDLEGEPRTQFIMQFVHPKRGNQEKTRLPKELLPFLIRAMKIEDRSGYAIMALRQLDATDIVPTLIALLRNEESVSTRVQVVAILRTFAFEGRLGPAEEQARAALREALQDADPQVQKSAGEALNWIEAPKKR